MIRVSKVYYQGMEYGWLFDIQSVSEFTDWFKAVRLAKSKVEFADALRVQGGVAHAREGQVIDSLAGLLGISLVDALTKLNEDLMNGAVKVIRDRGRIFINGNGGYFGYSTSMVVSDTKEIQHWVLPTQKLRVIQWPGGAHYYAKVGDIDVVENGKQKWDSKAAAEKAGAAFMKREGL